MPDLYLFDIDGTLVDIDNLHISAYKKAYKKAVNKNISSEMIYRNLGKVEAAIHKSIFSELGIIDKIKPVIDSYTKYLLMEIKNKKIKKLTGAVSVLKKIKSKGNHLGIFTGNSRIVGEAILKNSNLYDYFEIFSYGWTYNKGMVVSKAIKSARRNGLKFKRVIVIGDGPYDMIAAKENKAIGIHVSTGRYGKVNGAKFSIKSLKGINQIDL